MNNDEKEISNLLTEVTNSIDAGKIKLADAPTLKAMINRHLNRYDGQINDAVSKVKDKANKCKINIESKANSKYQDIIQEGKNYQQALKTAMARQYSPSKIKKAVNSIIQREVSDAINMSEHDMDNYFASLNTNQRKVNKLTRSTEHLQKQLDKANKRINQTNYRFWYGIAITIIVTACVVWLFL